MSPSTLKLGDKLLCKYNFPMSYVCKGGKYTFKSYDSVLEGFINLVEHQGRYSMDCFKQIDTCNQHDSLLRNTKKIVSLMLMVICGNMPKQLIMMVQ